MDDDDLREAPGPVVGSVAAGVAPIPFLAVYAVLFIARGTVRPVIPPDIGSSKGDELVAGLVALALLIVAALAAFWFLDGRRRWLFVLAQVATLATSVDFLVDTKMGPPGVPIFLLLTSLLALVLAFVPASWVHMGRAVPRWLLRGGPDSDVSVRRSAPVPADPPDVRA